MSIVRAGTTLTEVLMSLLIMSIGVVSVATLFPISALRTLEASKQTNSTLARFITESLVDVDPAFVHNPDGVFPPGGVDTTPYGGSAFRGQNYLVDPIGWQGFNENGTAPGTPLPAAPYVSPRDYFGNTQPATVNWPLPRRYTGASLFPIPYPATAAELIYARVQATGLATLPDNWKLVTESQIINASPVPTAPYATPVITTIDLDNDADLSTVNLTSGVTYRAVIFDIDGTHSETRTLSYFTAASVTWADALPARFNVSPSTGVSPNLGKVRIEQLDLVYTWMVTVRKRRSGPASVDVVVFFKRNFDPAREQVWECEFRRWNLGPNGVPGSVGDDNGVNGAEDITEIGYPGSDDTPNGVVTLKVPSAATDDERPKLHRGGYIFDTKNALWYRIRAIQPPVTVGAEDWIDVTLDETVKLDNTEDLNSNGTLDAALGEDANGDGVLTKGGAVVHPNVVNVFSLEIKEAY